MKKCIFIFCMSITMSVIAQNSNLNKTAEQKATEMTVNIAQCVQISVNQQEQIKQAATQYYESVELLTSADDIENLYHSFQQTIQNIMTMDVYSQWVEVINTRIQQKTGNLQNIND